MYKCTSYYIPHRSSHFPVFFGIKGAMCTDVVATDNVHAQCGVVIPPFIWDAQYDHVREGQLAYWAFKEFRIYELCLTTA